MITCVVLYLWILCIKYNGDNKEDKYVCEKVVKHPEKMASNLLSTGKYLLRSGKSIIYIGYCTTKI